MKSFLAEFKETLEITFFFFSQIQSEIASISSTRAEMLSLGVEVGRREFYYYFKHPFFLNLPKSSVKVMHGI